MVYFAKESFFFRVCFLDFFCMKSRLVFTSVCAAEESDTRFLLPMTDKKTDYKTILPGKAGGINGIYSKSSEK